MSYNDPVGPMAAISSRTGVPVPTLKRWKKEGCWPAGRAALSSIDDFIKKVKPYRGSRRPADVVILKLAGLHRTPTVGLDGTLIKLMCVPEGEKNSEALDAYQFVAEARRTVEGRRIFARASALSSDDLIDDQAPQDVADDRADNAQSAVALVLRGEPVSEEMVDDLAQLMENQASRLDGSEPQLASDRTWQIAREALDDMRRQLPEMSDWLTNASIDDMADAVAVAVDLDKMLQGIFGGRDDRGDGERWRGIGRMAPLVGVDPKKVVAMLEVFTALRDGSLVLVTQPTLPLASQHAEP
jgi:hypothetical protein